jgi:tetratricopeptide (TPR) repeat protein
MKYCLIIIVLFYTAISTKAQTAESYYQQAKQQMTEKMYSNALAYADSCLQITPNYPKAYLLKGLAEYELEHFLGAVKNFNLAIELNPQYAEAYYNLGLVHGGMGEADSAIVDFTKMLKIKQGIPHGYYQRGLVYVKKGETAKALLDFDKAIIIHPKYAEAYYQRGLIQQKEEAWEKALADFSQAIIHKKDYEAAYQHRAEILMHQKAYTKAIRDWDAFLKLNPYGWDGFVQRAIAKTSLGQYESALADTDRVIAKKADYAEAYLQKGNILLLMKKIKESCAVWQQAQDLGSAEAGEKLKKACK